MITFSKLGSQEGDLVGYRVRFEEKLSSRTRIKFLTDGMMLREAIIDSTMSSYGLIILDEAHERTVNSVIIPNITLIGHFVGFDEADLRDEERVSPFRSH